VTLCPIEVRLEVVPQVLWYDDEKRWINNLWKLCNEFAPIGDVEMIH
jgi:hypothetical protein